MTTEILKNVKEKDMINKEKNNGFVTVTTYEYKSISDVIDFIESIGLIYLNN